MLLFKSCGPWSRLITVLANEAKSEGEDGMTNKSSDINSDVIPHHEVLLLFSPRKRLFRRSIEEIHKAFIEDYPNRTDPPKFTLHPVPDGLARLEKLNREGITKDEKDNELLDLLDNSMWLVDFQALESDTPSGRTLQQFLESGRYPRTACILVVIHERDYDEAESIKQKLRELYPSALRIESSEIAMNTIGKEYVRTHHYDHNTKWAPDHIRQWKTDVEHIKNT